MARLPWLKRAVISMMAVVSLLIPTVSLADTDGAHIKWDVQSGGTYTYWVYVCDSNVPDGNPETRIIDAINEWNEIGGELHYSWTNWSSTECQAQWGAHSNVVWISMDPLSGGTLGDTDCQLNFSGTEVEDCRVHIDSDGQGGCASYSWYYGTSGPGSNQVDFESVLVHEIGHTLHAGGHEPNIEAAIMDNNMTDVVGGCPEHVEKDERVYYEDTWNYGQLYGYNN